MQDSPLRNTYSDDSRINLRQDRADVVRLFKAVIFRLIQDALGVNMASASRFSVEGARHVLLFERPQMIWLCECSDWSPHMADVIIDWAGRCAERGWKLSADEVERIASSKYLRLRMLGDDFSQILFGLLEIGM